jgi:hypothetical protein
MSPLIPPPTPNILGVGTFGVMNGPTSSRGPNGGTLTGSRQSAMPLDEFRKPSTWALERATQGSGPLL